MSLTLENIATRIGDQYRIKPTHVTLHAGHFNVLLGATGSGKTSLMKIMAGLTPPAQGEIFLKGKNITHLPPQKRQISLVHQFFVNYPHMSVFDNIASPLRVARMNKDDITRRVHETADMLQLRELLPRMPHELSGGQQQRTALARAIVKQSEVIFLDEPLANLDYKLREELRDQLPDFFADRGTIVVYATSEPEEALELGGAVALLTDGTIQQFGPTIEVYQNPQTVKAADIFSSPPMNKMTVHKNTGRIECPGGLVFDVPAHTADLADGSYILGLRPYHLLPVPQAPVRLEGIIQVTELSGSQSCAHFSLHSSQGVAKSEASDTFPAPPALPDAHDNWVSLYSGALSYDIGARHDFYFDPAGCFFFYPDGRRADSGNHLKGS
ncbi:MAG: ABC transporter ATP-binding protein [Pseudomonadota bacterium]